MTVPGETIADGAAPRCDECGVPTTSLRNPTVSVSRRLRPAARVQLTVGADDPAREARSRLFPGESMRSRRRDADAGPGDPVATVLALVAAALRR